MIRKYFTIAWRNLRKNGAFSLTNILGLTIGITCTILILMWVQDERSWDKFHEKHDTIFQVYANRNFSGEIFTDASIMLPLGDALKEKYPQVKKASFVSYPEDHVLILADKKLRFSGYRASADYFDLFTWKFIKGNAATALAAPDNIVLTQSTARVYFGDEDPVGKLIRMDNNQELKVSALVADPPKASTFQFAFVMPYNYEPAAMQDWENAYTNLFIEIADPHSVAAMEDKINALKNERSDERISTYFLHPMKKWRLYGEFQDGKNTGGMIAYVKLFTIIAFVILMIACVNFMNLSTAGASRRSKEVGVRKTLGSRRIQLILQFFFESITLSFIAFVFSIVLIALLLPSFNTLVGKQMSLPLAEPGFWLGGLALVFITGIIAGSYPAIYLSSFNPVKVLKGSFQAGKGSLLPRRILVVGQFVICILLISATIVVYKQLQHVKNRDLGYQQENLIMVATGSETSRNYEVIKQALLQTGQVAQVTKTSAPITDIWNYSPSPDYPGKPPNSNLITAALAVADDYVKTTGMKLLDGRDFYSNGSDTASMLLNETLAKKMNLNNPVGTLLKYGGRDYTVVGVVADMVMGNPYSTVEPLMIRYRPQSCNYFNIRLKPQAKPQQAIRAVREVFQARQPDLLFDYSFIDEAFGRKFATEELIGKLTNLFAGLAIFICCLGLSGLTAFTTQKRIREIGIRKVLGASVSQLMVMLSREFVILVGIALLIAVPLTWWLLNNWLQQYTYRTGFGIELFVLVGGSIGLLTIITVCLNAWKATVSKPVKSLRSE